MRILFYETSGLTAKAEAKAAKARAVDVLACKEAEEVDEIAFTDDVSEFERKRINVLFGRDVPVDRDSVTIPDDWRELPWTQQGDAEGLTLRGLAADLSDAPILNKKQATAAIEAELRRRAPTDTVTNDPGANAPDPLDIPQDAANGLTIRELHASLEGLGVAFDPADDVATKFSHLTEAREILAA